MRWTCFWAQSRLDTPAGVGPRRSVRTRADVPAGCCTIAGAAAPIWRGGVQKTETSSAANATVGVAQVQNSSDYFLVRKFSGGLSPSIIGN